MASGRSMSKSYLEKSFVIVCLSYFDLNSTLDINRIKCSAQEMNLCHVSKQSFETKE